MDQFEVYEKSKGIEVLFFEEVELTKTESNGTSFIDIGTLSVLYFEEYKRFLLYLNGWGYALLKRLPVYMYNNQDDLSYRYYSFPVYDGFYNIKLTQITSAYALENFETILKHATTPNYKTGQPLIAPQLSDGDDGIEENFEELESNLETVYDIEAVPPEKDELEKLERSDKFKRGFARFADKLSRAFIQNKSNINIISSRDITSIKATPEETADVHYLSKRDIERFILKGKHLASKMKSYPNKTKDEKNISEEELLQASKAQMNEGFGGKGVEMSMSEEMKRLQEEKFIASQIFTEKEQALLDTLIEKERNIEEQEILIRQERRDFEEREKALRKEIEDKIKELKYKEKLTDEEYSEFRRREDELMKLDHQMETEMLEMEGRHAKLLEAAQAKEASLRKEDEKAKKARKELLKKEKELETKLEHEFGQIRSEERLVGSELKAIQKKEEEIYKQLAQKETEKEEFRSQQKELHRIALEKLKDMTERKEQITRQREDMIKREKELETEKEEKLAELGQKVHLTEEERLELNLKEEDIDEAIKKIKEEQLEIEYQEEEFEKEVQRIESELMERKYFAEAEKATLDKIKERFDLQEEIFQGERRELEMEMNKLIRESEKKEYELREREKKALLEALNLKAKEEEVERELERRLAELKEKDKGIVQESIEFYKQEKRLEVKRENELRLRMEQANNFEVYENKLLEENQDTLKICENIQRVMEEVQEELSKPITVDEGIYQRESRDTRKKESQSEMIGGQETTEI